MQKHLPSLSKIYILIIAFTIFINGCKNDVPVVPTEPNQYLVSSALIKTLEKDAIIAEAGASDPLLKTFAQTQVKNGVSVYKITYKTKNTDGASITASGALILPTTDQSVAMISIQHGTITADTQAPSNFNQGSESATLGTLFGSIGYVISYPDYIGYGESKSLPHPYEHRASLASSSLDMLRAAKEFLKGQKDVKWNNKLYVGGYSEGGYATLSLQKKIEEEASSEFNLRASSCGAGAYDKTAFMKEIINNTTHGVASYNKLYLWVLLTYDRIYKLNKPTSYYFKEPYATEIAKLNTGYSIAQSLNTIFTDSFKKAVNDGTDTGFINAVADNDVYNWKPKTPTRFYHGDKDQLVFYFNSVNAVNAMKKQGATDVELITIPNGDHASSITTFLLGTFTFFTSTQ